MKAYSIPKFSFKFKRKNVSKSISKIDTKIDKIGNKIDKLIAHTECKIELQKSAIQKANDEINRLQNDLKNIDELKTKLK